MINSYTKIRCNLFVCHIDVHLIYLVNLFSLFASHLYVSTIYIIYIEKLTNRKCISEYYFKVLTSAIKYFIFLYTVPPLVVITSLYIKSSVLHFIYTFNDDNIIKIYQLYENCI